MKINKALVVASTSLLWFPSLFFPEISTSIRVNVIENSAEIQKEPELLDPLVNTTETKTPIFSFEESQEPDMAGKHLNLNLYASQEVSDFIVDLSKGITMVEDKLPADIKLTNTEGNKWQVQTNSPRMSFSIPVIVKKEGEYEISVGESKMMLNIQAEERQQTTEQEVISLEENETEKTEETGDEIQETISSEIALKNSTDELDGFIESTKEKESLKSNSASAEGVSERNANHVVEVGTWDELNRAVLNTFTGAESYKNNSDYIKITNNIENPGNLGTDTRRNLPANRVDFVIDGQGHTVDFNSVRYTWVANVKIERNIYIKNINMYGQSAYGPFAIGDTARLGSTLTFENVYYRGSQLTASWQADMVFKGNNEFYSVNSYVSPLSGRQKNTWANQSGLEAFRATFEEDSTTIMEVENGNGLILASYLGNTGQTSGQEAYARLAKNAKVEIRTLGNTGEIVGSGYNIIGLAKGNLILEEYSSLDISTLENTTRGGINLTENTAVKISDHARLNININGEMRTSAITLGARAKVKVSDYGALNIALKNQGTSVRDVVAVGANSEFDIGEEGDFSIKVEDGSGVRNLINVGANGIFQFNDSNKVDLDSRNNQNAHLINMSNPGSFRAYYQNVSAWCKGFNISDTPDFNWKGISIVNITYNSREITGIYSIFSDPHVMVDFQENYRTTALEIPHNGFSRVFFDRVPGIELTINSLTENKNNENSHTITGKATPGSFIRFSGDKSIPVASWIDGNIAHTRANEHGEYLYKLSEGSHFTGGNTVTAVSTMGIRTATASTVVEPNIISTVTVSHQSVDGQQLADPKVIEGIAGDHYITDSEVIDGWNLVAPPENASGVFSKEPISVIYIYEEILDTSSDLPVDPENKPELPKEQEQLSLDFVSSFNFGAQAISVHDQTYYAQTQRLLNEDETMNKSEERPNYVQISDRRSESKCNGWELAIAQKEQFKGEENQVLNGASLSLLNQQVITAQDGTAPGIQSVHCTLIPGNRRTLLKAQASEGVGTWIYRFGDAETAEESVALNVPGGANPEATCYSTILVWELSVVPDN